MLKLFNTLSKNLEEFKPIRAEEVSMYHCGPTVYDYAHIGNLRSYVFADLLRRTMEYLGYEVKQVINITDIGHLTSDADTGDDKMVKGLKRENLPLTLEGLKQLAGKYEDAFKDDLKRLNIKLPQYLPRATEHLEEEIRLISELLRKDFAYKTKSGIYFDTNKVEDYGKLGGLTPKDESEARVEQEEKKNGRDFVLWKFSSEGHIGFESPWGTGFPGWHIECSAMSREILGQPFDIHTGGMDHIPVHHNNEIAQSEAAYDTPLAGYWLHNEFVRMAGDKMAKSSGNFIILKDILDKGFTPMAYRYFLLLSHYRTPTTFSWDALEAADNALKRLYRALEALPEGGEVDKTYQALFKEKIENDLNTPQALAVLWTLLKDKEILPENKSATLRDFDRVLGLGL